MEPKYLNSKGTKASTVVSPFDYEKPYVVLVEGPFDALSLNKFGVNSAAVFGSNISSFQIELLKAFSGDIVLGFDNDEAGVKAVNQFIRLYYKYNLTNKIFTVKFPKNIKDWNELYLDGYNLNFYVNNMMREYSWENKTLDMLNN
jgi:DNA primase